MLQCWLGVLVSVPPADHVCEEDPAGPRWCCLGKDTLDANGSQRVIAGHSSTLPGAELGKHILGPV